MRRFRGWTRVGASILLSFAWFGTVGALANGIQADPVPAHSHPDLEIRMLMVLGGMAAFIVGVVVVLLSRFEKRAEDLLPTLVAAAVAEALRVHNDDQYAHTAASEHAHIPIHEDLDRLGGRLEAIFREHDTCAFRSARDPKDSPKLRRADDPDGFNATDLRGANE